MKISDKLIEQIKFLSPEQLEGKNIIQRARRSGYICPFCRDGSGKDGTGMSTKQLTNGQSFFCGKCQVAYDNIALLAAFFGKDSKRDFPTVIELTAGLFELGFVYDNNQGYTTINKKSTYSAPIIPNKYKIVISDANAQLKEFINLQGGSWRGLTFDTLNKYFCGYKADCIGRSGEPPLPHVIIPSSFNQYLARLVGKPEDYHIAGDIKIEPKPHHGSKEIFGLKLANNDDPLIFLVEGEIDAMTIWQASGFNAIAISGVALSDAMRQQLKNIPKKNFIVLFDNDDTGKQQAPLVVNTLKFIGHQAVTFHFSSSFKDANEFFQADPRELTKQLEEIYSQAKLLFAATNDFNQRLDDWQKLNGKINPELLPKIAAAKNFIDTLSPSIFNPEFVFNVTVRERVALCKFYLPETAQKFFDTLKTARETASEILSLIKTDTKRLNKSGDAVPVVDTDKINRLANLVPSKIQKEIDSLVATIKRNHKDSLEQRKIDELNEQIDAEKKAYRESPPSTRSIINDCPIDLILPEGVFFSEQGISMVDFDKPVGKNGRPIIRVSKNPIVPTKILREPASNYTQYEIYLKTKGSWKRKIFDGRTLIDPKKISELADFGALIDNATQLAKYFSGIIGLLANEKLLPEIKCYPQPGWVGRDFKFFAYPTGGDDYIVRRAGFDYEEIFASCGDPNSWKETFINATNCGGALVRIFLGNSLSAPLVRPLNILNPQIHLSAPNDSGKTGLQKLAASIFGNPAEMLKSFAATPKNSLSVASASNDLPSFFDELETLRRKTGEDALSQMIYEFAQGIANQANKRDGTPRATVRFKGSKSSTAERPMLKSHDQRGAFKRLLQLDTREKIFDEKFAAELHFVTENNFGHFGRAWIDFIVAHLDEIRDKYLEFGKLFANIQLKRKVEPTLLKTVTVASLAFQYFCFCIGEKNFFDAKQFCDDIKEIILTLPTPEELDDSTRALNDLQSFIASHEKYFARDISDHSADGYTPYNQSAWECFGKIFKTGEVAFFPTALKKILELELGFASMDMLVAEWARKDFLRCTKGKGYRCSTKINGKSILTIRFKDNILLSNDNDDDFS